MTDIDNMSNEELTQALQEDISAADEVGEGTYSEQEGELEENTQEEESEEVDGDPQPKEESSEPPKKESKSIKKLLSERNEMRKRIQELESMAWTSKEVDIEYINKVAEKVASELIYEKDFFKENPDALEIKDDIKELARDHNLDLERAYKLYMLENNPEELRIQENKKSAKKLSSPSYSNSKLRAMPNPRELSSDELAWELKKMIQDGKFKIY